MNYFEDYVSFKGNKYYVTAAFVGFRDSLECVKAAVYAEDSDKDIWKDMPDEFFDKLDLIMSEEMENR